MNELAEMINSLDEIAEVDDDGNRTLKIKDTKKAVTKLIEALATLASIVECEYITSDDLNKIAEARGLTSASSRRRPRGPVRKGARRGSRSGLPSRNGRG